MTQGVSIVVGDTSVNQQSAVSGSYGNDSLASGIYKKIEDFPEDFENVVGMAAFPVGGNKTGCIILRDDDHSRSINKYKVVHTLMARSTIGAGATATMTEGVSLANAVYGAVTVSGVYNASAISGVSVHAYSSPMMSVGYDTNALFSFDNTFAAGASVQTTNVFTPSPGYIKFSVKNNDVVQPVISGSLWLTLTKEGTS